MLNKIVNKLCDIPRCNCHSNVNESNNTICRLPLCWLNMRVSAQATALATMSLSLTVKPMVACDFFHTNENCILPFYCPGAEQQQQALAYKRSQSPLTRRQCVNLMLLLLLRKLRAFAGSTLSVAHY